MHLPRTLRHLALLTGACAAVAGASSAATAATPLAPAFLSGATSQPDGQVRMTVNSSRRIQGLTVFHACAPGAEAHRETRDIFRLPNRPQLKVNRKGVFGRTIALPSYEVSRAGQFAPERFGPGTRVTLVITGRWVNPRTVTGRLRVVGEGCDTGTVTFVAKAGR